MDMEASAPIECPTKATLLGPSLLDHSERFTCLGKATHFGPDALVIELLGDGIKTSREMQVFIDERKITGTFEQVYLDCVGWFCNDQIGSQCQNNDQRDLCPVGTTICHRTRLPGLASEQYRVLLF